MSKCLRNTLNIFSKLGIYVALIDLGFQVFWALDLYVTINDLHIIHHNGTNTRILTKNQTRSISHFYILLGCSMLIHLVVISLFLALLYTLAHFLKSDSLKGIWMASKPLFLSISSIPYMVMCLGEIKTFMIAQTLAYFVYTGLIMSWVLIKRNKRKEPVKSESTSG